MKRSTVKSILQILMLLGALGTCVVVLGLLRDLTGGDRSQTASPGVRVENTAVARFRRPVGPAVWKRPPLPDEDIVVPPTGSAVKRPDEATKREKDVIPDEYVLSFRSDADREAFVKLAGAKGCRIMQSMDLGNSVRLRTGSREQFDELLAEGPEPSEWSPNCFVRYPELQPRDPLKPESGYTPFGDLALRWLGVNKDNSGWGSGVTVAVLDTGIGRHSCFDDRGVFRVDLVDKSGDGIGASGHGTAVGSLIAGVGEDIAGVSPSARLLSFRVLGDDGVGDTFTLAQGIVDAVERGAQVINMCLGTYGDSHILREAVNHALDAGVILVGAAGNDAVEGVVYPARYDGVIAVAAVDGAQRHLYFSNRGEEVDLAAPGMGVNAAGPDNGTILFSGTSAAVPFVSGAVAWLIAANPGMKPEEVLGILLKYADDAGAPGADDEFGEGILSLDRIGNREVKGIYNAAAGAPYLNTAVAPPVLVLFLENRGTEELPAVDLKIEIDGIPRTVSFYNVGVGQTVSTDYALDVDRLTAGHSIAVVSTAVIDGIEDSDPGDNTRRARIFVPAGDEK